MSVELDWDELKEYLNEEGISYDEFREDKYYYYKIWGLLDKGSTRFDSKKNRYKLLKKQKFRCRLCGRKLKFNKNSLYGNEVGHIDHIHPKSLKRSYDGNDINEIDNLQMLCATCNLRKHNDKFAHLKLDFWKNRKKP